jgi:hypothetical protein
VDGTNGSGRESCVKKLTADAGRAPLLASAASNKVDVMRAFFNMLLYSLF